MHPVILVILLVALMLFISWLKRAPPEQRSKAIIYAAIAAIALLVLTGRMHWLLGVIGAGIAIVQRLLSAGALLSGLKSFGGARASQSSDVQTEYLRMSLDHETGAMDGEVLKGSFKGRRLSELALNQLGNLFNECVSSDQQSAAVLDSYLNRRFGADWRDQAGGQVASNDMTRDQAFEILGLSPGASDKEITDAHRRLMQKLHPDRGGSTYLASQINRAKDILLGARA